MPDGWEVDSGLYPLFDDGLFDWDADGLASYDEYARGLDPMNPDTDEDGLGDGDEVDFHATDPLKPCLLYTSDAGGEEGRGESGGGRDSDKERKGVRDV